jgi:predicted RNase H-like nuclease (RuvC/YqgF family)
MTLNEREIYYGQQIKEYQDYINQATHETEKIRAELHQIHEENDLKEKKTNALINELKQNYEKLQIELNDRGQSIFFFFTISLIFNFIL